MSTAPEPSIEVPRPEDGAASSLLHKISHKRIDPPALTGPPDADVTLIGWGSTDGVIEEGLSFREAHRLVGQRLTNADRRSPLASGASFERRNGGRATADRCFPTPIRRT